MAMVRVSDSGWSHLQKLHVVWEHSWLVTGNKTIFWKKQQLQTCARIWSVLQDYQTCLQLTMSGCRNSLDGSKPSVHELPFDITPAVFFTWQTTKAPKHRKSHCVYSITGRVEEAFEILFLPVHEMNPRLLTDLGAWLRIGSHEHTGATIPSEPMISARQVTAKTGQSDWDSWNTANSWETWNDTITHIGMVLVGVFLLPPL